MENYICDGERMQITAATDVTAGDLVKIGSKIVVAITSALEGAIFVAMNEGVFEVAKEAGAVTQGQALYFKADTKTITTSGTGNTLAGYAFNDAASGDATVEILLVDNGSTGAVVAANIPAISVADATDLASAQALANACKATINSILAALKAAGTMAAD
jgi:predicted RecA/RadA family phage recombinase